MTQPRSRIVDPSLTRWYHCVSRCVRRAFLFAENREFDRKDWLKRRLKELDAIFAVSVAGFSWMDNHLHLLPRIDPDVAQAWTPIKANITQDVQSIFDRLEMDAHRTLARVTNLLTSHRFYSDITQSTLGNYLSPSS